MDTCSGTTCTSCGNALKPQQLGHRVFYCSAGHTYSLCSPICERAFEKRCHKAEETLRSMLKSLQNRGSAPALRQIPKAERDKLLQLKEADNTGSKLCPYELRCGEKSHPHCALVMKSIDKTVDRDTEQESTAASSNDGGYPVDSLPQSAASIDASDAPDSSNQDLSVLDDDKLVVLQRVEEEAEEAAAPHKKKKEKVQKKKTQVLDIDFQFKSSGNEEWGVDVIKPPVAKVIPPRDPQEFNGPSVSLDNFQTPAQLLPTWAPPPQTVGPTSWVSPEREAVAPPSRGPEAETAVSKSPPAYSIPLIQELISLTGCAEAQAQQFLRAHRWKLEAAADAYFAWGANASRQVVITEDSNPKQWQQGLQPKAVQAGMVQQHQKPADLVIDSPKETRSASIPERRNVPKYGAAPVQQAPQLPTVPSVAQRPQSPAAPVGWEAVWCPEHNAHYFWEAQTGKTQWRCPSSKDEPAPATSLDNDEPSIFRSLPAVYVCDVHWTPDATFPSAIQLLRGDRAEVTWIDGEKGGWAYGVVVGNEATEGYFPQDCLSLPRRQPQALIVGMRYFVEDPYVGPAVGYLSVKHGSLIEVVYQELEALTWVYAKRLEFAETGPMQSTVYGWIPESVLSLKPA